MSDGVEIARAYVTLTPSMQGVQGAIAKTLVPEAASAGDKAASETSGKFGSGIKKYLGAAAIAGVAVAGFKGLYSVGAIFDDLEDTIRTSTGASGKDLDALVGVAEDVGRNVPVSFDKIGPVVADLNRRLGLSGDTLNTVAQQYLQAGNILGEDVDITKTTKAFSAFGIEGAKVEGAMDTLFRTAQATGIGMNDLAGIVQTAAPATKALGFSFDETAALVGTLDKAGLDATKMTAAMSKSVVTLAKDGEKPADAFRRTVDQIQSYTKSGDEAKALDLAASVFGTKGAPQFVDALKSGKVNLDDLVKGVGASSDTILGVADDTADFAEKWQILKNNALLAIKPLASAVFNTLASVLSGMLPTLKTIGTWLSKNPGVIKGLVGVVGALAGAWLLYKTYGAAANAVTKIQTAYTKAAAAGQWLLNAAMNANPIALIVIAVVALVAAIVILWKKNEGFRRLVKKVWDAIKAAFQTVVNWFTQTLVPAFKGALDKVIGFFSTAKTKVTAVWDAVISWFKNVPGKIASAVAAVAGKISEKFTAAKDRAVTQGTKILDWFKALPGKIGSGIAALAGKIGERFSAAKDKAVAWGTRIVEWYLSLPGKVFSAIAGVVGKIGERFTAAKNKATDIMGGVLTWFKNLPGKITSALSGVASVIGAPFKTAFNTIAGWWNNSIGKISFTTPDWLPKVGGKSFGFPKIPLLAAGGTVVSAGTVMVGERGPELLNLPTGASVVPLTSPQKAGLTGNPGVARLARQDVDALVDAILTGSQRIARGELAQVGRQVRAGVR